MIFDFITDLFKMNTCKCQTCGYNFRERWADLYKSYPIPKEFEGITVSGGFRPAVFCPRCGNWVYK